jgi:hypothetical protein
MLDRYFVFAFAAFVVFTFAFVAFVAAGARCSLSAPVT